MEDDRSKLPIVGKGTPSGLAIYHEGVISGLATSGALFPDTTSSVLILSNSTLLEYDDPRFIAEVLIETLIGGTDVNIQNISPIQRSQNSAQEMKGLVGGLHKSSRRTSSQGANSTAGGLYGAVL